MVVVVKVGTDSSNGQMGSHQKNKTFCFAEGHLLWDTHVQRLHSKHAVVIFTGKDPSHPGPSPQDCSEHDVAKWKRKANHFGRFFLHTYCPEADNYDGVAENERVYDYDKFCHWLESLRGCPKAISQFWLRAVLRSIYHFKSSQNKKDRMTAYHGHSRTIWMQEGHKGYINYWDEGRSQESDNQNLDLVESVSWFLDQVKLTSAAKVAKYSMCQRQALINVLGHPEECDTAVPQWSRPKCASPVLILEKDVVKKAIEKLSSWDMEDDPKLSSGGTAQKYTTVQEYLDSIANDAKPSDEQMELLNIAIQHFQAVSEGCTSQDGRHKIYSNECSPRVLVLRGPGAGKTMVVNMVPCVARIVCQGVVLRFSYMGIAVALMGGATFSSTFFPNQGNNANIRDLNHDQMKWFWGQFDWPNVVVIIIDEISTFSPQLLAVLDKHLHQVTGHDIPFGGIMIWLVGDFMQAKPVLQLNFPASMMEVATGACNKPKSKLHIGTMSQQGVELFQTFCCYQLKKHQRTKDDTKISDLITRMHNGKSLYTHDLHFLIALTKEDVVRDPSWKFAPVLVATNWERHDIVAAQAIRFGREKGIPVVWWPRKLS